MRLEVAPFDTVQAGLKELLDEAYSMKQNFRARIDAPILSDGTDLLKTWLNSKTIQLYGKENEDNRVCFKIDHSFNLEKLIDADTSLDGSIAIDEKTYNESQGTEFIVISRRDLKESKADYAIRADKYQVIKEGLNKGKYCVNDLEKAGGFKVCGDLTPDEAKNHDGWLELAVGKNNATANDYGEARRLISDYVAVMEKKSAFSDGTGMGFFVEADLQTYKARSWFVYGSDFRSLVYDRYFFHSAGQFLRYKKISAEDSVQKK